MTDVLGQKLVDLFRQSGRVHHETFLAVNGNDPEWPLWYADYLLEKLRGLLQANLTKSELIYLLVLVSKEQAEKAPGTDWPTYYADFFLERYGPTK